jgi:hypothetical protein
MTLLEHLDNMHLVLALKEKKRHAPQAHDVS